MRILLVLVATLFAFAIGAQPSAPTGFALSVRNTFPNASTTGIPSGTSLTTYTGSCTITADDTVIDAKTVNCNPLIISGATNVTITRSKINGEIQTAEVNTPTYYWLYVTDSEIEAQGYDGSGITGSNYKLLRVNIHGGKRPGLCWYNCLVEYSYIHGQLNDITGQNHQSGFRMEQYTTLRYNTIVCDSFEYPPEGGCSASISGYPDFQPINNNLVEHNFFPITNSAEFCVYGGNTGGKPYSGDATNATYIRFVDNIFERTATRPCGNSGPVTDFDPNRTGNLWSGNVYFPDGATIPSQVY